MKEIRRTLNTLSSIYKNYGGITAVVKSPFLHLSVLGTLISWPSLVDGSWPAIAKNVLPNLAGFSIAAYAMIFAMIDAESRKLLRAPISEFDNRSPFLALIGSISHAVIVQVLAIFIACLFDTHPLPYVDAFKHIGIAINVSISFIGLTMTFYGILLVVASILMLFRLISIIQKSN